MQDTCGTLASQMQALMVLLTTSGIKHHQQENSGTFLTPATADNALQNNSTFLNQPRHKQGVGSKSSKRQGEA